MTEIGDRSSSIIIGINECNDYNSVLYITIIIYSLHKLLHSAASIN